MLAGIERSTLFIGRESDESLYTLRKDWQAKAAEYNLNLKPISSIIAFRYMTSILLGRLLYGKTESDQKFLERYDFQTPEDVLAYAYKDTWLDTARAGKPLSLTGTALIHKVVGGQRGDPRTVALGVAFRGKLPDHRDDHRHVDAERAYFDTTFDPHKRKERTAEPFPYVLLGQLSTHDVQKYGFDELITHAQATLPVDASFSKVNVGGGGRL